MDIATVERCRFVEVHEWVDALVDAVQHQFWGEAASEHPYQTRLLAIALVSNCLKHERRAANKQAAHAY